MGVLKKVVFLVLLSMLVVLLPVSVFADTVVLEIPVFVTVGDIDTSGSGNSSSGSGGGGGGYVPKPIPKPEPVKPVNPEKVLDVEIIIELDTGRYTVNGVGKILDVKPVVESGRALVPIRFIAEALGYDVEWYGDTQLVEIIKGKQRLELVIGELIKGLDVPAKLKDGRTLVPLRFVAENFGCDVEWVEEGNLVEIKQYKEI